MIGDKIKDVRKKTNVTLKKLSQQTNLSIGYLSNIERNVTSPTLANLQLICNALSVDTVDLINSTISFDPVVRHDQRPEMFGNNTTLRYEMLTAEGQRLRGYSQIFSADHENTVVTYGHEIDELGIVIKGSLHMELDGVAYDLEEGDTIYIRARTLHKFHKTNEGECVVYWVRDNTQNMRNHKPFDGDVVEQAD